MKLEIELPEELVEKMDRVLECLSYESREEFVLSAVRRLLDRYKVLGFKAFCRQ